MLPRNCHVEGPAAHNHLQSAEYVMAGVGDVVRRMDYLKRAKNTLGVKRACKSTMLQEHSNFVKSANEHQNDKLLGAMRKMEADEKVFRDGHTKQLSTVKRFHNTVHTKSTDFHEFNLKQDLPSGADNKKSDVKKMPGSDVFSRRGSLGLPVSGASSAPNQKRRHSVQADTSKYGRSFRKLRDAIAASPKTRVSPESLAKPGLTFFQENTTTILVKEAPCL